MVLLIIGCNEESVSEIPSVEKDKLTVARENAWADYRGVNVANLKVLTEQDVEKLAGMHVNLIRLSFTGMPLVFRDPPYGFNEQAFERLDEILAWCEKYGIRVVLDPHAVPGTRVAYTMYPTDPFWSDLQWRSHVVDLWKRLARTYKDRDVILGYDLLNEPAVPRNFPETGPGSWNELVGILVSAIRDEGDRHWIIVEPAVGATHDKFLERCESVRMLKLPDDDKLVISPHVYEPQAFTHQGVHGRPVGIAYPGEVDGRYWDKDALEQMLAPVREFQKEHHVPVFIGEFSASRSAGMDGNAYLQDLIGLFNAYGWGWAYHAYKSAEMWDPELSVEDPASTERSLETTRMKLLMDSFQKNP